MTTKTVLKDVIDMYVTCSLKMMNFNSAVTCASDCCGNFANSAVEMRNGQLMWRCRGHQGIRDFQTGELGAVHFSVKVKEGTFA